MGRGTAVALGLTMAQAGVALGQAYWRGTEATPGAAFCVRPAATGVKVVCDRWPDGSDLRQFGQDAMRLSGATTPQEQAIAVWRWVRRWTMYTDGNVPTEKWRPRPYIDDPIKVLNVYGTHWCDGLSRAMELVWRAQGGRAEKLYRSGHTMCDVFYRDADGVERWHLFDVSEGGYMYHHARSRLLTPGEMSTDAYNYMATWIHCAHLGWPTHRVELALRDGEYLRRLWGNEGKPYQDNVRYDHQTVPPSERGPYPIGYGNGTLGYGVPMTSERALLDGLATEPVNLACEKKGLQPRTAGTPAVAVWRIRSPYVIARAEIAIDGRCRTSDDSARLSLSVDDGKTWKTVWEKKGPGEFEVKGVDLCPTYKVTMKSDPPENFVSPFGRYAYLVRLELMAKAKPEDARVSWLFLTTTVQHNVYALPQLQPGRNRITVSGTLDPAAALEVMYVWDDKHGRERMNVTVVESTPFAYEILADGAEWNDVVCKSLEVRAVPKTGEGNRTVVKETPCDVRLAAPLSHPDGTRARWQRPLEGEMPTTAACLAVLSKAGAGDAPAATTPDGVEETQAPPPGTTRTAPVRPAAPELDVRTALAVLADRRDPAAFDAVKKAVYERAGRNEKERAVVALYASDATRAVPVLLDVLEHPEKVAWREEAGKPAVARGHWCGVAAIIAEIMVQERCTDAVPGLIRVLDCPEAWDDVRWQMVRSLGRLGDPRAREAVRRCLSGGDGDLTALAARAAGELGDREAIPLLRRLLKSGFELSRESAANALGLLGDKDSAPALRELYYHRDENLRAAAIEALGRLKEADESEIRIIRDSDAFRWVREIALRAVSESQK
jgi:HEAT repeat protein